MMQGMFEYIWAADDFLLFKRLMIKHNLDLEMQALNLMQAQDANGIIFVFCIYYHLNLCLKCIYCS